MRLLISRSQVQISEVADFFLLIRGLFLIVMNGLYTAAFLRVLACAKIIFCQFGVITCDIFCSAV